MWCTSCALAVEGSLKRLEGVREVSVHYPSATLCISGTPAATQLSTLAAKVKRLGYRLTELEPVGDAHARLEAESRYLTLRLMVGSLFGMWTMLASLLIYAGALPSERVELVLAWVSGAFSLPVVLFAGMPFYRAGWRTLLAKRPGMDVLVSLGVIGAVMVSVWLLWRGSAEVYFDTAVMLIVLLLVGRLVETLCRHRGVKALDTLTLPDVNITVWQEKAWTSLPVDHVNAGMRVELAPGELVALDGILEEPGWVDTASLTGESLPRHFNAGQAIYAGCRYLGTTPIVMQVSAGVGKRRLDRLCDEMRRYQAKKGELQKLADRFAAWLSPLALVLALLTLPATLLLGLGWEDAFVRALSVLVVACPCAVGLAVPLASLAGSGQAMQQSVALRDPAALETLARIRSVALDKTGTLTTGSHAVLHWQAREGIDQQALQRMLSAAVAGSEHPLAQALARWASSLGDQQSEPCEEINEVPGEGRRVKLSSGEWLSVGSASWMARQRIVLPDQAEDVALAFASQVMVADEAGWLATFYLSDQPVDDAEPSVKHLLASGYVVAMISGDRQGAVSWLGERVGLAREACYAQRSPEAKARLLQGLPSPTLYVGDGLNDTLSLAAADVGIAPLNASEAAREGASAQLMTPGIGGVVKLLGIAKRTRRIMVQNLFFSALYNTLALGLVLLMAIPPLVAVLAMAASSLTVTLNAARLAWAEPDEED
ncbi:MULTISPECIES: cation-translocating P-type ATPase [unclassified Halomonas]|uniref:heavy metal translocating P-type ATPase n=1 Tax=unclassified Halomonas TaxID=2609666 RepID=UPI0007D9630E|nr:MULTISPECIES: cation-translocating P-type ATPase [unclassified Halomonas]MBT2788389.1 cation-translocating P-type ATPase [Halomonas sp. ISL-106]MBT2797980.1 cation-translocating P-type ATPase [Halomonas sp. ISL-104]OAL60549.1 ATPase P [Halomonas sp. ALS9]